MIKPMWSFADQLAEIKIICRDGHLRIQLNETDFEDILKLVERRNSSITLIIHISDTLCRFSGQSEKHAISHRVFIKVRVTVTSRRMNGKYSKTGFNEGKT